MKTNFPNHWGNQPFLQTRDIRELPHGYGFSSSSLCEWINRNVEKDMQEKKNILNKTKTYLIGAIEYASDGRTWREEMTEFLKTMNVTVFDPYKRPFINSPNEDETTHTRMKKLMESGRFDEVSSHFKQVRALDLSMVDRSDFIICYIDPKIPSFGTVEELVTSTRMKRATFVVIEGGKSKTPLWIMGMIPHKYIYSSFQEVKDMLTAIDSGEKEIDSDRWRLFQENLR